ncbi:MAG: hypothetical protein ACPKQO_10200 [Nitrososphaeraceae archaeon]
MNLEKSQFLKIATIISVIATVGILSFNSYTSTADAYPKAFKDVNITFGKITSIQNDEEGNPTWIATGNWKTNLINNTDSASQNNGTIFTASFKMIKLDGTASHGHAITDLVVSDISNPNDMTTMINGTTTMSMKDAAIPDIQTSITVSNNKVISIWLDPETINNHLGNTPLYGIIQSDGHKGKYKDRK